MLFRFETFLDDSEVSLAAYPDTAGVTYKVYKDVWLLPMQTTVAWPSPDTVLPRGKPIVVSAYHSLHNGTDPFPWQGDNSVLPELVWECSEKMVLEPLADQGPLPNGYANRIRRVRFSIPQNAPINGNALGITIRPKDPNASLQPITVWWRVADTTPARQIYITPTLNATQQPANCTIPVTATLIDVSSRPVPRQRVQWSWQRGTLPSPEVLGDGLTDENGRAHAVIQLPAGNCNDTLIATSGNTRASCPINASDKAGGLPAMSDISEPLQNARLTAGQPHNVKGRYGFFSRALADGKRLTWSTDPYTDDISFAPNASNAVTTGFGGIDTIVTARQNNDLPTVALLAVSPNPVSPHGMDVLRVEGIRFTVPVDSELIIETPEDGDSLLAGSSQIAQARFVDKDGTPIRWTVVDWSWENVSPPDAQPSIVPASGVTDFDGACQVAIRSDRNISADLHATAIDPATGRRCQAWAKSVAFTGAAEGPGRIDIASEDGTELRTGIPHTFTATYTLADGRLADGQVLTWSAGNAPVQFDPPTSVVRLGHASTRGTVATSRGDVQGVTIVATTPNPHGNAGTVDRGKLPGINFDSKAKLLGLAVDKALAANPFDGQYHADQAAVTIKAALRLIAPSSTTARATLALSEFGSPARLYGRDGKALQADAKGNYLAPFDTSGRCDFQIMSPVFSLFTLTASYAEQTLASTQLVIADIDGAPPADIESPLIHGLNRQTLNIDTSSYTFRISMDLEDADSYIDDNATLAVWLNGRIVFAGTGSDIDRNNKRGGAFIGNAGLVPDTINKLVLIFNDTRIFKKRTFTTTPLLFHVTGTPRIQPTPGALAAPDGLPSRVTAWDAARGVKLTFSEPIAKFATTISVFCFFEDNDPNARGRHNVVQFDIPGGTDASLVIPQIYLAGYATGSSLRVNYSIAGQWSQIARAALDSAAVTDTLALQHEPGR
ncbi:MAG TPA: hypothetical protein VIM98_11170 [Dyella sp.]|uniref:hypothetical protein n=1 Tax=Dyella sp. TaxID=1869338 RepID=UPI002F95B3C8